MKDTLIIYLVAFILILFTGCECHDHQVADLNFNQADLRINPYNCSEILVYKDLVGDTVVFQPGIRITYDHKGYTYEYLQTDGNVRCKGDYFYAEYNDMLKESISTKAKFEIYLTFLFHIENPVSDKGFHMSFSVYNPEGFYFNGIYRFDVDTLYSDPNEKDFIASFHQFVNLGPKTFNNVYELFGHNPDPRNPEWISSAYYSINEGLVGFRTNFGKTWYLYEIN